MNSPKDFETFLNSLPKPEKGQAEKGSIGYKQYRYDEPLDQIELVVGIAPYYEHDFVVYLMNRCRRAESLRVPEGLRESIKKAVLAGMDAQAMAVILSGWHVDLSKIVIAKKFRALCTPDSTPSETNREEVKG